MVATLSNNLKKSKLMGVMYQLSVRSSRKVATTASIIRTREFRGKKNVYCEGENTHNADEKVTVTFTDYGRFDRLGQDATSNEMTYQLKA